MMLLLEYFHRLSQFGGTLTRASVPADPRELATGIGKAVVHQLEGSYAWAERARRCIVDD
jgi:hypothetical protein